MTTPERPESPAMAMTKKEAELDTLRFIPVITSNNNGFPTIYIYIARSAFLYRTKSPF